MIKGYTARVGGMYVDVLVAQSVGPVATKHLISLIKRPLAGSSQNSGTQSTCQDCTHLPSSRAQTVRQTDRAISQGNTSSRRKETSEGNSGQILKTFCLVIQQKQGSKLYLKRSRDSESQMYLLCLTTRSPVCSQESRNCIRTSLDREL